MNEQLPAMKPLKMEEFLEVMEKTWIIASRYQREDLLQKAIYVLSLNQAIAALPATQMAR